MILSLLLACAGHKDGDSAATDYGAWLLPLPAGFPTPKVPIDNDATPEKFDFGRYLFYDARLSGNATQSCSDCHIASLSFSDGLVTPTGSSGDAVPRNSLALVNTAWEETYTWPDPLLTTLEDQVKAPMFGSNPAELDMTGHEDEIVTRLKADPTLVSLGAAAFPDDDPFSDDSLIKTLATYIRGLISSDSPYDRFTSTGDASGMSDSARRGEGLFFGETADCYHCHQAPNFTVSYTSQESAGAQDAFFNTGLYNTDGNGAYPPDNQGLYAITGIASDMGRFRAPTLRNIALTAPYMHDGSVATLEDVVDIYNRGGRDVTSGPYTGDGATNPYKNNLVRALNLSDQDKADLVAFMESLTDQTFLSNTDYLAPPSASCPDDIPGSCPSTVPSYAADVAPILTSVCAPCHVSGGSAYASYDFESYASVAANESAILDAMSTCHMPPAVSPQLTDEQRATLLAWLVCGSPDN